MLSMAIFLSEQGGSLNEARSDVKMCISMISGSNKCSLVEVIGLFNKTVTLLNSFIARRRLNRILSSLKPQESVLFCIDLQGFLLQILATAVLNIKFIAVLYAQLDNTQMENIHLLTAALKSISICICNLPKV